MNVYIYTYTHISYIHIYIYIYICIYIYIYYVHLAFVRFEHSVYRGSLMTTHIYSHSISAITDRHTHLHSVYIMQNFRPILFSSYGNLKVIKTFRHFCFTSFILTSFNIYIQGSLAVEVYSFEIDWLL